ncbi:MAG TPA: hypothetical protein VF719_06840, partial [Abditibacteriaceae bacterium]
MYKSGVRKVACAAGFAGFLLSATLPVVVRAQEPANDARTVYVYSSANKLAGNRLGEWGNGSATPSREWDYNGDPVLQVKTLNFYEGARFDLKTPVDLTPYKTNGYFRFRVRFREIPRPATAPGEDGEMQRRPRGGMPDFTLGPVSTTRLAQFGPLPPNVDGGPRRPNGGLPPLGNPGDAPVNPDFPGGEFGL